jgi:hypothetical protein
MIRSSRLQCNCRQWHCSYFVWPSPEAIVCYGFFFTVTIVESVAQSNLCIAQNLEWKPVYVSSSHGLCSDIISTVFIRIQPSHYYWRWLTAMFITLTVKFLDYKLNNYGDFKIAGAFCSSKTRLDYLWLHICDKIC